MKRTYQPNKRKKAKKHGFFARIKSKVLNKRRRKGRKKLGEENTTVIISGCFVIMYFEVFL